MDKIFSAENIEFLTKYQVFPILIGLLAGLTIVMIIVALKPAERAVEVYTRVNGRLRKGGRRSFFDYQKVHSFLLKNGVIYRWEKFEEPAYYVMVKIMIGLIMAISFSLAHYLLFPIGFIFGYKIVDIAFVLQNKSDNKKMQEDIILIYNTLSIQIRSGVLPINALQETKTIVKNKRLWTALRELSGDMTTSRRSAIKNFNEKFDNQYIDSLCVTVAQADESGHSVELLGDIAQQVKAFDKNLLDEKKQKIDRHLTIGMLILFLDVMAIVIYVAMRNIVSELGVLI